MWQPIRDFLFATSAVVSNVPAWSTSSEHVLHISMLFKVLKCFPDVQVSTIDMIIKGMMTEIRFEEGVAMAIYMHTALTAIEMHLLGRLFAKTLAKDALLLLVLYRGDNMRIVELLSDKYFFVVQHMHFNADMSACAVTMINKGLFFVHSQAGRMEDKLYPTNLSSV